MGKIWQRKYWKSINKSNFNDGLHVFHSAFNLEINKNSLTSLQFYFIYLSRIEETSQLAPVCCNGNYVKRNIGKSDMR